MITPLRNFAVVQEGRIFRSAQPQYSYEYNWISKVLNLKTIVNLRSELDHDKRFCPQRDINEITFSIPDHKCPTVQDCLDFMRLLDDQQSYPILFHCQHGQGRTSTFSVLVSLHAGLTLDEAVQREKDLFDYEFKHQAQLDFLKEFIKTFKK